MLTLEPGVAAAIRRHAREAYPHECCGALIGAGASVGRTLELANSTEEGARRRFLIRPDDYRAAEDAARRDEAELLGFYHSHPDAPARPSPYDLEHAWPSFAYLIVSVGEGAPAEMTSWRLEHDRSRFSQEPLTGDELETASDGASALV